MNLKVLLIVSFLATVSSQYPSSKNGKKQRTEEEKRRFREWKQKSNANSLYQPRIKKSEDASLDTFVTNLNLIESFNKRKNETYKQGLTDDADLTFEEKKSRRTGAKKPASKDKRNVPKTGETLEKNSTLILPKSLNYTRFFPPIKNQGSCLSCWAFAAVSVVEYYMWKQGKQWNLSEQNLVDCSKLDYGCGGGWPTYAFNYIRDEGISNGKTYSYKNVRQECQRNATQHPSILKIPNVCEVYLKGREEQLQRILVQYGPVAGAMTTTEGFTNYKSGVFNDIRCRNDTVDHAITIVGYGTDKINGDYWIIRNSWGTSWGMYGYGWVARNKNNACGIALYAIYPC